jgi:UDP:flavonoid glycosyltransferase YjiC (YdhE family)
VAGLAVSGSLRVMVASVGWTGHVYPALALARALREAGHEVLLESFESRREVAVELGLRFEPSVEAIAFGPGAPASAPDLAIAARGLGPLIEDFRPDVVVSDMWTLAPALAAERAGVPRATLIPHPYPVHEPGLPLYPLGLLPARTPLGRAAWRAAWPAVGTRLPNTRLREVRGDLDATRRDLGLAPLGGFDGQISERLALIATFPQLEYPRRWPAGAHVTGPMAFERPHPDVELPPGDEPLVLVASSTERDPRHELASAALEALEPEPVRVVVALNRRGASWPGSVPGNARVHDWVSYSQLVPAAAAVLCHGGHGTISRALAAGTPVIVSPRAGDMAENGARVAWFGAGLMLPERLLGPRGLGAAVRRLLSDPGFASRAGETAAWARDNDGAAAGARLVAELARVAA